jgi:hypothetical protein
MAHLVLSFTTGTTTNQTYHAQFAIDSSGGIPNVIGSGVAHTVQSANYGLGAHTYPSINFDPTTKRLFTTWSAGATGAGKGIRFRTASYSAGSWTWGSEVEVNPSYYVYDAQYSLMVRWDASGNRALVGGYITGAADYFIVFESTNFTSFSQINSTVLSAGSGAGYRFYEASFAVDSSGDIHIFGMDATQLIKGLQYRKWTRSTLSMGQLVVVDGFLQPNAPAVFPYAWYSTGKINWIYTAGNNSPYAIKYDRLELS